MKRRSAIKRSIEKEMKAEKKLMSAKPRKSAVKRKTKETEVMVDLDIDGKGKYKINTQINFLDQMLALFAQSGGFDLTVRAKGSVKAQHHLVKDTGIALGQAFSKAVGGRRGIQRPGYFIMPIGKNSAIFAVDISGKPNLLYNAEFKEKLVGDLSTELIKDFFQAFVDNLEVAMHILLPYGNTDYGRCEAVFKSFGKSLDMAISLNPRIAEWGVHNIK